MNSEANIKVWLVVIGRIRYTVYLMSYKWSSIDAVDNRKVLNWTVQALKLRVPKQFKGNSVSHGYPVCPGVR